MKFYNVLAAVVLSLSGLFTVQAAPWVDTSDVYLRADIQALADAGVITVPVNTYPLMWAGIGSDLRQAEPELMSPALVDAFARVNFYYRQSVGNKGNKSLKLSVASDPARFQHFGSDYREKGEAKASYEYLGERFAYKISTSAAYKPQDDKEVRFDDSYLAMIWGNWIFSAGTIDQWWGPGFDSALIKSNNARPLPAISVSRNNSHAFDTPWLSWVGPWTLTTGISLLEEERAVSKPAVWYFRGTVRPVRQVEIGLSWTTMLCGEGEECGLSTLWDAMSGGTTCPNGAATCDSSQESKIGNQMAGYDIRYADTWLDVPVGVYLERTCEDSSGPAPWKLADCGVLFGADTRLDFDSQQYKLFFEYTDTMVACGLNENAFNCFYEHGTYASGSRYYGRSLGSTYDSDAKVYVLGVVGQFANSVGFNSQLRYARLNNDGSNRGGVWAPQPPKEDLLQLEVSYRMPLWRGMVTLGGTVSKSEFDIEEDDNDASIFGSYEFKY